MAFYIDKAAEAFAFLTTLRLQKELNSLDFASQ